ncbi:hypothetical protein ACGFNU_40380 [Spirillospora sp. NPDC048911]|uniref:hypothetical protein n=1 Tax=Spirillospora sp. NPDC048911 TaxID=3364527 RepID=UPI0037157E3E
MSAPRSPPGTPRSWPRCSPWPGRTSGALDLEQALLRLPRDIPPGIVSRARRLVSPEGGRVAAWLGGGGLRDPEVTCEAASVPRTVFNWRGTEEQQIERVLPTVVPARTSADLPDPHWMTRRLLGLPRDGWSRLPAQAHVPYCFFWWPSLLPSHREVLAAHLLIPFADGTESREGQGGILLALAEADGPVGPAMATALAFGLTSKRTEERSASVDAFLTCCARGRVPPVGEAIAVRGGQVSSTGSPTPRRRGPRGGVPRRPERDHHGAPGPASRAWRTLTGRAGRPHRARHRGGGDRGPRRLAREAGGLHRALT